MRPKAIHSELLHLSVFLGNSYPRSDAFVRAVDKALKAVDAAKCDGDNAACRDHPEQFSTRWYYGSAPALADVMALPDLECRRVKHGISVP